MIDMQNKHDHRNLDIDKAGVKDILYPIRVLAKNGGMQHTVAKINMYVDLPRHFKGTHMSRFVEILHEYRGDMSIRTFSRILDDMVERLDAQSAHIEVAFPYFIEKAAPVTGTPGMMEYACRFICSKKGEKDFRVEITAPVTTLCPCSREISTKGAHNQRGRVTITLRFKRFFWIEDIIHLIESSASAEVYSVLKRPDEKYLTEQAYANPMFVEDVVRTAAQKLEQMKDFSWYAVEAENFESIHNHSAYAYIEKKVTATGEQRDKGTPEER
ncbi:MAG: GTP cyclohydrolase I FolE2 [Deltaproteobacteria bacterium]|nr:GTP cyclohydrolase I FolE2 [Deltaproteobacteria bacterium]